MTDLLKSVNIYKVLISGHPVLDKSQRHYHYGGVKVSTGVVKPSKRAAVGSVCVKKDPLKRNDKTNNNFALAA